MADATTLPKPESTTHEGARLDERVRTAPIEHATQRAALTLSRCNRALVRARAETELLYEVCRIIVEHGYVMAWIGFAEHDAESSVRVAAHHGVEDGYLERANISWADNERGRGPTGVAIRSGKPAACRDFLTDPSVAPWREEASRLGFRASLVLPLLVDGKAIGALCVYAADVQAFDVREFELLEELAADLAWGVTSLRERHIRMQTEKALAESEARLRTLTENLREVVWLADAETRAMLYVSSAYERLWGRSCESLYRDATSWFDAVHPDDRATARAAVDSMVDTRGYDVEYRIVRADGEVVWVHDRGFPIVDADGRVVRMAGVTEDVTARRRIEEQLRQVQKMDAIGRLAGGVAHDFNNILAAILLHSESTIEFQELKPDVLRVFEQIANLADRGAGLTRQLLQFSRQQVMQPKSIDVSQTVRGLSTMLERLLPANLRLDITLEPDPCVVHADPSMIEQVLLNLVINARDAMPNGGVIDVVTSRTVVREERGAADATLAPGEYVVLQVADRGIGIPDDVLPRIYEPFFTTKTPGKGTGLGLATVFGIVQQHHGSITVTTEEGRGTTFSVLLPANDSPRIESVSAKPRARRTGNETILLAEDEPELRTLTRAALERAGYRVVDVSNGVEALKAWSERAGTIDLLATDLVMPLGLGGSELASILCARDPSLKVITFSGYSADVAGRELELGSGKKFLQKPFSTEELLDAVRDCLDS